MKIDSVIDQVVKFLTSRVITGEFPPGHKLNETELASKLDVSRPSLREAFRILEQKHLIKNLPRKGSFVAELSIEDFTSLYRARDMIECYAIDLIEISRKRKLPKVESTIKTIFDSTSPPENDPQQKLKYLQSLIIFHYRLVEAAGNEHILRFYETIVSNLARYQFIYLYEPNFSAGSDEDHKSILDQIGRGEYKKAKTTLRRHMSHFSDLMCSLMTQESILNDQEDVPLSDETLEASV